jgi:hypothetical protein
MLGNGPFYVFRCMQTNERGQATAVVLGVAALVILTIVGMGIYAYKNPTFGLYGKDDENKPKGSFYDSKNATSTLTVATSTSNSTSTIAIAPSKNTTTSTAKPATTVRKTQTATVYQSAYGSYPFGITVPRGYTTTAAATGVYGGIQPTAAYHFYANGAYAFTVNVFSKEQWNDIRIQETRNVKEGTGPEYLGEGRYLGENKTWIYSQLATPVVYGY